MPYANRRRRDRREERCAVCLFLHAWYAFVPHSHSPVCSVRDIREPLGANRTATNTSMVYAGIDPCYRSRGPGGTTTDTSDASGRIDKRHIIDAGADSTVARPYTTAKGSRVTRLKSL